MAAASLAVRAVRIAAVLWLAVAAGASARTVRLSSPGRTVTVEVRVPAAGPPCWRLLWRSRPALDCAAIGLDFADPPGDRPMAVRSVTRRSVDRRVTGLLGKASGARDLYREAVVAFGDIGAAKDLSLVVRAYDDGAAYRWRFRTGGAFVLTREDAGFGVPADATLWTTVADGFQSSYEDYYRTGPLDAAAPRDALLPLPVLFHRGRVWGGISEAALHDWAGLYLTRTAGAGLSGRLSPRIDRPGAAVLGDAGPHRSPWRVLMLGDTPGALIELNLVTLLNPPPDRRDWSWVRPGKTSFPWWNDYWWPTAPFTPGLNTATMHAYVDWDAAHGIAYHTLDGFQGQAGYGGPIIPDGSRQDLTRARPAIDLPAVLAEARRRHVGIRVWTHWIPLSQQLEPALAAWQRMGVQGIMVDFMNRDDQQMVAFYDQVTRAAADHHLTVVFHGAYKPTGEIRTWPNQLSREAVRGTEYDKFDDNPGSTPGHEATLPFTRMLAGPLDVHSGGFAYVDPAHFANRNTAPRVMGTRARTLASYVVFENPLPMVADSPERYDDAPSFRFIAATPTVWDATRVLGGDVGHWIVIARRKGCSWWLGAITDDRARTLSVSLARLGGHGWRLTGYADGDGALSDAIAVRRRIAGGAPLTLRLRADGGFAARLDPVRR